MVFARSTALRASTVVRAARPTRCIRAAEQPWQRMLQQTGRRTYASEHGYGTAQKSDLPWMAGAAGITAVGLYVVLNQDLAHGEGHEEGHAEAQGVYHKHEEAPAKEEAPADETKEESKEEPEEKKEEDRDEKAEDEPAADPAKSDEPTTIKPAASDNEMSGKQEGLSNDDTGHTSAPSEDPQKSKKGEGAAESAKLKGTVSTDRPAAENKEERGKSEQDKSQ